MNVNKTNSFYFASKSKPRYHHHQSVDDEYYEFFLRQGEAFLDKRPLDAPEEAFCSRLVVSPEEAKESEQQLQQQELNDNTIGTHLVERKVPCKVEPKVLFAAERTFFTWVRSALFLFGASITVLKYSHHDPTRLIYGSALLTLAVVFILYPLIRFQSRVRMLRRKDPGPYYDTTGPVIICSLVMLAIISQFCLRLFHMSGTTQHNTIQYNMES